MSDRHRGIGRHRIMGSTGQSVVRSFVRPLGDIQWSVWFCPNGPTRTQNDDIRPRVACNRQDRRQASDEPIRCVASRQLSTDSLDNISDNHVTSISSSSSISRTHRSLRRALGIYIVLSSHVLPAQTVSNTTPVCLYILIKHFYATH